VAPEGGTGVGRKGGSRKKGGEGAVKSPAEREKQRGLLYLRGRRYQHMMGNENLTTTRRGGGGTLVLEKKKKE